MFLDFQLILASSASSLSLSFYLHVFASIEYSAGRAVGNNFTAFAQLPADFLHRKLRKCGEPDDTSIIARIYSDVLVRNIFYTDLLKSYLGRVFCRSTSFESVVEM